jgi:hypothetical protein
MYGEIFPTEFAKKVMSKVGLYPDKSITQYNGKEKTKMMRYHDMLEEFQQIAIMHGSQNAKLIYLHEKLTEAQEKACQLVGDFSALQATGMAVESMMRIVKENRDHKDYTKIMEMLVNNIKDNQAKFSDKDKLENLIEDLLK